MFDPTSIKSFGDELSKIAESWVRTGRRPISADRLLEKEIEDPAKPSEVFTPTMTTEVVTKGKEQNEEKG